MILAELYGKIPSKLADSEDILTSNVFSFFKYSGRSLLSRYLNLLGVQINLTEKVSIEFLFWHKLEDRTEPDVIIICDRFYILIEAKLYSDFADQTPNRASQIDREIKIGKLSAQNLNKQFIYIALTAEYFKDSYKYSRYENSDFQFIWTNWQTITSFLRNALEENIPGINRDFAQDVYNYLVKKKLISFKGLNTLRAKENINNLEIIFYDHNTSEFKGEFTGYINILEKFDMIEHYNKTVYYYGT